LPAARTIEAYSARRISHASLTRSTRADREEVQIEALYELENPLSWLFPLRLAAPLWLEILEGNLADGLAPVTIFRGLALTREKRANLPACSGDREMSEGANVDNIDPTPLDHLMHLNALLVIRSGDLILPFKPLQRVRDDY
jgi:hypothetical protein